MVFSASTAFQWQITSRSAAHMPFVPCLGAIPGSALSASIKVSKRNRCDFWLQSTADDENLDAIRNTDDSIDVDAEKEFILKELVHLDSLQSILDELEDYDIAEMEPDDPDEMDEVLWDEDSLNELFGSLATDENDDDDDHGGEFQQDSGTQDRIRESAAASLEKALLQGVVPVGAGVGGDQIVGDFGFDPFNLATKDYFRMGQSFLINLLPGSNDSEDAMYTARDGPRPRALILRDYREAEIRHGRLAMLAAMFWPLQEMLDRLLLDDDQFGPLIYGPTTLPYFPLVMTAIMLLLGYLDIYSQAIKDMDKIGEAFLPGDCFWDPLKILQGAPDSMKRNMQERELFNGRVAMLAIASYLWEETITHVPIISIASNSLLFLPAYQVPFIQEWLDARFAVHDPESAFSIPENVAALIADSLN